MTIARLISFTTATLASPLLLGISGSASAQGRAGHAQAAAAHAPAQRTSADQAAKAEKGFTAIAEKLNTTPDALKSAYDEARQANPKLTRGQFVAANMLAHNLGSKNSAITTEAILSGVQSGKSIGQTLQGLGLSEKDAEAAERQAKRDAVAAQRATS